MVEECSRIKVANSELNLKLSNKEAEKHEMSTSSIRNLKELIEGKDNIILDLKESTVKMDKTVKEKNRSLSVLEEFSSGTEKSLRECKEEIKKVLDSSNKERGKWESDRKELQGQNDALKMQISATNLKLQEQRIKLSAVKEELHSEHMINKHVKESLEIERKEVEQHAAVSSDDPGNEKQGKETKEPEKKQ